MNNQKIENLLNLALDATPREREKSLELDVGYESKTKEWEVVVKYSGNLERLESAGIRVVRLLNEYAVLTVKEELLHRLAEVPEIEYIEKPKRLFFSVNQGRAASCINALQTTYSPLGVPLFGNGILVGFIDSGIDYRHLDFRKEDGSTRIRNIWDQTIAGSPPSGYQMGTEYSTLQINEALQATDAREGYQIVPSRDISGHGTQVAGIAVGNGRNSGGNYRGVASQADIIVVKLGVPRVDSFPRTTELMQAVDYVIRKSLAYRIPVAINLSFGNSYGSHDGNSLLETYLDDVANLGRSVICVGTGNNANRPEHTSGKLETGKMVQVEVGVSTYETTLNIQLWKSYADIVEVIVVSPSGELMGPIPERLGTQRFTLEQTEILLYYGEPSPYNQAQELYLDFIPVQDYINSGVWQIRLVPKRVVEGYYDMWLPGGGVLNEGTRFFRPTPDTTLTIPSTANRVISVGAYDSRYDSYADFSGRGYTRGVKQLKPDLAAPGVQVQTTAPENTYAVVTGTSFATPFVTGSAALLMEWGIVKGNDPFLYGEKVKAYLRRGARKLPGYKEWPNPQVGYGALCVKDSLPV